MVFVCPFVHTRRYKPLTPKARGDVVAIVQARMRSTRLPGKVIKPLGNRPLIARVLERVGATRGIGTLVLATTERLEDDPLVALAEASGVVTYRGPADDVLARYVGAARATEADWVVRVSGDNPFIDPGVLGEELALALASGADYVSCRNFPFGTFGEIVRFTSLERAAHEATDEADREHVTMYIKRYPEVFRIEWLSAPLSLARPHYRLTVDEPADYALASSLYERFGDRVFSVSDVVQLLDAEPGLALINAHVKQAFPFEPPRSSA